MDERRDREGETSWSWKGELMPKEGQEEEGWRWTDRIAGKGGRREVD